MVRLVWTARRFQSTLSMRRATTCRGNTRQRQKISIHALHEESDHGGQFTFGVEIISIHALHEESDDGNNP